MSPDEEERRHVLQRASVHQHSNAGGDAEVKLLDVTTGELQVIQLDVPMHKALGVNLVEDRDELYEHALG
jgi:hypothetical protein